MKKEKIKTIGTEEVRALEKKVIPFTKKAEALEITDTKDMAKAAETLSVMNQYADEVKKKKETITKPLNEALKAARAMFAPLEDKLEESIKSIRSAMIGYQTEEKKRSEAEALKIAQRVGEGKGKLSVDTAVRKMENIKTPEKSVATDSGLVKFQTVRKFRVMDITMLPHEYLLANEVMIRKAMLEGIQIQGVDYYTEEVPINFR